ncbi:hypothetical protein BFP72_14735 [Reichenbachiella sp. 5M10]|uniref:hypothetical protein n=1 Tax=Reichenbachiella sp. 5M10 TaxID=1889772 RepID=UPI000C14A6F2|nr:hypothetical protein [Reichenbachiella sp. 5M10]PIB36566.1 hypothetical protein BFP72_14735 [Reichenbachiella sp. 5M10]
MKSTIRTTILVLTLLSCQKRPQLPVASSSAQALQPVDAFWKSFQSALQSPSDTFLLSHIQDSLSCTPCSTGSTLSNQQLLADYRPILRPDSVFHYSIYPDTTDTDTLYHINYTIDCLDCPEGTYNLIFDLAYRSERYLLTDIFTVP